MSLIRKNVVMAAMAMVGLSLSLIGNPSGGSKTKTKMTTKIRKIQIAAAIATIMKRIN